MDVPKGTDPREFFPHHRERGPAKREITLADIAEAAGLALSTVQSCTRLLGLGLHELAVLIVTSRARKTSRRMTEDEERQYMGDDYEKWEKRWPRFELWTCGVPGCEEGCLGQGVCGKHGGAKEVSIQRGYRGSYIFLGKFPLHRLVMGAPGGKQVHHLDHNGLNNRPENLVEMPQKEHWELHRKARWTYGYADLARLLGVTEGTVRNWVHDKKLDPSDLEAVCNAWLAHYQSVTVARPAPPAFIGEDEVVKCANCGATTTVGNLPLKHRATCPGSTP